MSVLFGGLVHLARRGGIFSMQIFGSTFCFLAAAPFRMIVPSLTGWRGVRRGQELGGRRNR